MTELLCKLFVKDRDNVNDAAVRRRYGTLVSIVAIIINVLLFAGKFAAGTVFLSMAIVADAFNNLADAGSSVVSFISFRIAAKPADRKHPFGHARMEYVTSMIVSFLVLLTAYELLKDAVTALFAGDPGTASEAGFPLVQVIVLGVAVLLKLWLCLLNRKIGQKIDSSIMKANSADSLSDALSTGAVLVASVVTYFLGMIENFPTWWIDPAMSAAVGLLILKSGIGIFNDTKNSILGEAPAPEVIKSITSIVARHEEALGIHDMFVHSYGPGKYIVSFHVEIDGAKDVFGSHDMIDNIEKEVKEELGYICTVHMDPIVTSDEHVNALHAVAADAVLKIDERIRIHDFRFVGGTTHTNLIFDVAVPFEVKLTDDEIVDRISEELKKIDAGYNAVVTVDRE